MQSQVLSGETNEVYVKFTRMKGYSCLWWEIVVRLNIHIYWYRKALWDMSQEQNTKEEWYWIWQRPTSVSTITLASAHLADEWYLQYWATLRARVYHSIVLYSYNLDGSWRIDVRAWVLSQLIPRTWYHIGYDWQRVHRYIQPECLQHLFLYPWRIKSHHEDATSVIR